ncbi:zf-HC2 domain-containing protein [Solibacillus sp. FSL R5-0691]|uniref:zf-HC2 domain-containing protein n=1 Tax=unclassified Solibacillus TaxID=2637870 RepID=UPI0030D31048
MKTCASEFVDYMHEYLDGDISREHEQILKQHLQTCPDCQQHMHELSDTVAFIKSAAHITAPPRFEDQVISRLPKRKSSAGIKRWFRQHPVLMAAAVFFLCMSATLLGSFPNDDQFSVTKQPNLVIEGQTVTVPVGEVVKGDIVVKNGDIIVEGEVDGNITVINGNYMASTAVVTGQVEEIDEMFEWLWYKIKDGFNRAIAVFNK